MLLSDDRLTRRAIDGDEAAFATIFRRYQDGLYRYCLAIVGNPEDAQDALQNTMVKVLRALPGEERRIELKPWLYRIAHNESIELIRRRRPSEELDPEATAAGAGLAEEAVTRERLGRLLGDIEQLPERQRGALVMRELGGLGFEQIGAALGTSAAVARQTLYEARLGLRQMDAGRELSCEEVLRAISDADGRVLRRRDLRAHLRSCEECRDFRAEIDGRRRDLAALSPLPAAAAAGLLQALLGGNAAAGGSGLAAALGGGAAKTVATSAAIKGAATVAVVAVIGVAAADRGGLVDVGLPGNGGSGSAAKTAPASGDGSASGAEAGTPAVESGTGVEPAAATKRGGAIGEAGVAAKARGAGAAESERHAKGAGERGVPGAPELPSAAANGQETAAAHKNGKAASKPAKPAQPAKPAHPTKPAQSTGAAKQAKPPTRSHQPHPSQPSHAPKPTQPPATKPTTTKPTQTQSGVATEAPAPAPEVVPVPETDETSSAGN